MDWDQILVVLLVSLHVTDCAQLQFVTVMEGEDAVLSCGNPSSPRCESDWFFLEDSRSSPRFTRGQTDGAELMDNCTVVLRSVRREQAGFYSCTTTGHQQDDDNDTVLAVVTVSEHSEGPVLTLNCSVWTVKFHKPTLKWLVHGEEVSGDPRLQISRSDSSVSVSFTDTTPEFHRSLTCHVSDDNEKQEDEKDEKPTTKTWWTKDLLLRHIIVSAGLTALLICVGAVHIWARTQEIKTERNPHRMSRRSRMNSDLYEEIGDTATPSAPARPE